MQAGRRVARGCQNVARVLLDAYTGGGYSNTVRTGEVRTASIMKANYFFFSLARASRGLGGTDDALGFVLFSEEENFKFLVLGPSRGGMPLLRSCLTVHAGMRVA